VTDVLMQHTADGGEITVEGGRVRLDDGVRTAVYLSMFGGNERDAGTGATESEQWWGNLLEDQPARRLRSETQHLLRALPAITANVRRVEDAARRDLSWLEEIGATVSATATLPAVRRIRIAVVVEIDGERTELRFEEEWAPV